jgi:hypothetical protein
VGERDHLEDPGVEGRISLRCIFGKWDVSAWAGSSWLRIGTRAGTFEYGNEPSGSTKCGEFLDYLRIVTFSRRTLFHGVSK